ncbi:GNAT family N-acetyltransferase [Pseudalkalibacillus sp. A8]|uniref:GNAT family N-acetyltransferase n=1 Tax=Pseudalkalibacillus sp. A8 TaxID=3382641 RepID=UPI0038B5EE69
MIERNLRKDDLGIISEWFKHSSDWIKEEGLLKEEIDPQRIEVWMALYDRYEGVWLVWEDNKSIKGISYHILDSPSNKKPWIGMVMVDPQDRGHGYGRRIIQLVCRKLQQEPDNIVFAGCPFRQVKWLRFLAACDFEQIGLDTLSGKRYIKLARLLLPNDQ